LSKERSLEEGLQATTRVVEEEKTNVETDVKEGVSDTNTLTAFIYNTSMDKGWILDSGSVIHVCS